MNPLFDQNCNLIGWVDPGNHIFDTNMDWVAYISNGHAWSANSGNWIGPVDGLNCLDINGKPIAWNPDQPVVGTMRPMTPMRAMRSMTPMRPMRPMTPMRPMRPMTPMGGWSTLNWDEWLNT